MAAILTTGIASTGMAQSGGTDYAAAITEPLVESSGGPLSCKILVDTLNPGSEETRIAELTFAPGYAGNGHAHDAVDRFYALSGRFGHNVNGVDATLDLGDIGIVKPGDIVNHSVVGDAPAVVLTTWLPGGAAAPFNNN
jgi:quercetin dioxygenase-like cupin family protein